MMQIVRPETPDRILQAAANLFATDAYANISVDQIAEKAGLTKMTVYQHFKSKDKLLMECLRMRLERREAKLDQFFANLGRDKDPLLAIFDWLEEWLDPKNFRGCAFIKAVNELSAAVPDVVAIATEAKRKVRERITSLAKASGRANSRELGRELALLFEGAQSLALVEGSAQPAKVARRIAHAILNS